MKKIIYLISVTIAFVLAIMVSCGEDSQKSENEKNGEERLKSFLSNKKRDFLDRNQKAFNELKYDLKHAGTADFKKAAVNIDPTVNELCSYSNVGKICFYMAYDKLKGTSETENLIQGIMRKQIFLPCIHGCAAVDEAYRMFVQKIIESRNIYSSDIIQIVKTKNMDSVDSEKYRILTEGEQKIMQNVKVLAAQKILTGTSTVLEVVMIKESIRCIMLVCGHVVTKIVGTAGTAGIAAVSDGPLPFMDAVAAAIATGGIAWTAYDIYQVQKVLPQQVRTEVRKMIFNCQKKAREKAIKQAKVLLKNEENTEFLL